MFDSGEADSNYADRLLHHVKHNHYQWIILAADVLIKHMTDAIHDQKTGKYHLIKMDPRPNSWVAYSKILVEEDFIAAVKRIVSGNYASEFKAPKMKKPQIELALFYKDIRRFSWKKDFIGLLAWVINLKGYWKFIPFHDHALMRKIFKQFWIELVVFRFRSLKQKLHLGPSTIMGSNPRFNKC